MKEFEKQNGSTSETGRVLVVDDHQRARQSVVDILSQLGHSVNSCASAIEALKFLDQEQFDVIVTDLMMPGMNGVEFIRELHFRKVESQVVMVTAHASVETAVEAMRYGAFDYIEKPFDVDQIESLVGRALQHQTVNGSKSRIISDPDGIGMIGSSRAMTQLVQQIAQVAPTDVTVLITGESGTGKELVAQSIHAMSQRSTGAMVSLNCPALSPQLMESELFGHERGAFTNADSSRVGRFELAEGGTILLDEVTEVDLMLQAKLLRVLQERVYERVGSSQTRAANVRVLATTNRNLQDEVAQGRFREDLYFRLAVVPIQVPPLRERRDDVALLADHFLTNSASRLNKPTLHLNAVALELMHEYHWPGNVRELENLMTRASVLSTTDEIGADQLRPWLIEPPLDTNPGQTETCTDAQTSNVPASVPVGSSLHDMERALIEATLDQFDGHREKTAKALGIGVRTLTNKLRSYGYAPRAKSFPKNQMAHAS